MAQHCLLCGRIGKVVYIYIYQIVCHGEKLNVCIFVLCIKIRKESFRSLEREALEGPL